VIKQPDIRLKTGKNIGNGEHALFVTPIKNTKLDKKEDKMNETKRMLLVMLVLFSILWLLIMAAILLASVPKAEAEEPWWYPGHIIEGYTDWQWSYAGVDVFCDDEPLFVAPIFIETHGGIPFHYYYDSWIVTEEDGCYEGAVITFAINGIPQEQSTVLEFGGYDWLNLTPIPLPNKAFLPVVNKPLERRF
jgi:hypothetical protein